MKIRIHEKNREKIVTLLANVNGRSNVHVYRSYFEVLGIAYRLEKTLGTYSISKAHRVGVTARVQSGDQTSSAYKYEAITTTLYLYRGSTDWFLTGVKRSYLPANTAPAYAVTVPLDVLEFSDKRRRQWLGIVGDKGEEK